MVGGEATASTWNFRSNGPRWNDIADFEPIFARSASAVTPSEKSSINAIIGSLPRAFQWTWDDHRTFPLSPLKGDQKRKTVDLRKKIGLRLKKVCYKVSLCENCQRQSCKAFIDLTIRAKVIGGRRPLYTWNFGSNWPHWSEIADFRSLFARSDSAVTPSEKVQLTRIGSPLHAFRWASYVVSNPHSTKFN